MRRGPEKHSAETRAKMSATRKGRKHSEEHKAAIAEGIRRANSGPPRPWMTPARAAKIERMRGQKRPRRAPEPEVKAEPAPCLPAAPEPKPFHLELARAPTREELQLPGRFVLFWRWVRAQAGHDTVVGRLLAVMPWRTESEVTTEYRFSLAARLAPELAIPDDVARAAAKLTVEQWRAFCEVHHAGA